MYPGECFDTTTSALGAAHDFATGPLGLLIIASIGVAGLIAAFVSRADAGPVRALGSVGVSLVLGYLLALGSARVSTSMQCTTCLENWVHWTTIPQERWGLPAYFDLTESESSTQTHLHLQLAVDTLFWSGVIGLLSAAIAMRRSRRSLVSDLTAPRATVSLVSRR